MSKLYAERDIENLDTYCDHVGAMTREKLHSKSDIAAELAYRDQRIKELEDQVKSNNFCFSNKGDSDENLAADMQRELDADRWNALINSPFRLFGFAGLEHDDPTQPSEKYGKGGYAHFGCEMWTIHDGYDAELGKKVLIGFADQAIKANTGE